MADVFNSKLAALVGRLNGRKNYAVTTSATCTRYSCDEAIVRGDVYWQRHEARHKRQIAEEGWLKFMTKYLFFNCTRGYQNNPYEIEARRAETISM